MNDQKIELSVEICNAVMQYLGTRPYQEVFQIIAELQKQIIPQVQQPSEAPAAGLDE